MITQTCSMLFLVVLDNLESSQELELLSNQLLKEYASYLKQRRSLLSVFRLLYILKLIMNLYIECAGSLDTSFVLEFFDL